MTFLRYMLLTAEKTGLTGLLQSHMDVVYTGLLIFFGLCCFLGYRLYRVGISAVTFLTILLGAFTWALPAWGKNSCVTFCAVVGVAVTGGIFFAKKFDAIAMGAIFTGCLVYMNLENLGMPVWVLWVLTVIPALGAAALVFFFPYWGACVFSALWGSFTVIPLMMGTAHPALQWLAALVLGAAGGAVQIFLFRKQIDFKKIMPDRLSHRLELKKIERGA